MKEEITLFEIFSEHFRQYSLYTIFYIFEPSLFRYKKDARDSSDALIVR
mgnify:CR=1 FL=1